MQNQFVVVDVDGHTSFSAKKETPEKFASFKAAEARATELAHNNPGQVVGIYQLAGEAVYPIGKLQVTKR